VRCECLVADRRQRGVDFGQAVEDHILNGSANGLPYERWKQIGRIA
jgi:hypothetical protein